MRTLPENIVRFYVGCRPIARGGWYVGTVIVDSLGKELDGTKWRSEIATKKEAKALAASLNDELQELKAQ